MMRSQDPTAGSTRSTEGGRQGAGTRLRRWTAAIAGALMRGITRLQRHPSRSVRWGVATCLIVGGFLGFLPVLGLWMLPLGLLIISNEVGWLRRARRRLTVWFVSRYKRWRRRWA